VTPARARPDPAVPPTVWLVQRTDAAGGVTVIVDALVDHLRERRPWRVERVVQRSQADAHAARRQPLWRRLLNDAGAAWRLARALDRARPDVVVAFTPAFGAAAAWWVRRYGGRTVLTHHLQRAGIGRGASLLVRLGERWGLFDATVACSAAVAADFPEARALEVVLNGVPDVRPRADPTVDRRWLEARHGVPAAPPIAFAAGRLSPVKGHEVLVDALVDAVDWHLVIAGEGPSRAELAARAAARGVADRVHLVGRLEGREVWSLMRVADAYVQPSRAEGLSLALLEAFAMGAVVLTSTIAPNREVVAPGDVGVLVPGDDPGAWADALAALRRDPELAGERRRRVRAAYEARFDELRMLEGYERVVARVLTARSGRS
jgi:glycosyltransferase involved in cell wall biosynthesis